MLNRYSSVDYQQVLKMVMKVSRRSQMTKNVNRVIFEAVICKFSLDNDVNSFRL